MAMSKIDLEKVEYYKDQITKMAECDLYHKDSPELQQSTYHIGKSVYLEFWTVFVI